MASIERAYPIEPDRDYRTFAFQSVGERGIVTKIVLLQLMPSGAYNLAFGDLVDDRIDDQVETGNNDAAMVISTVVKCVFEFLEKYPGSTLSIKAVDERRAKLYNFVFRSRVQEIEQNFEVWGKIGKKKEPYHREKLYLEFEVVHKVQNSKK